MLPITLIGTNTVSVSGLLDIGATVKVLPSAVSEQLGAIWEQQTTAVRLSGNLAECDARVLVVSAVVGNFPAVRLAFAWTRTDAVPVLLGQVNFLLEFDVCFHRSRSSFEVQQRQEGL